MAKTVGTRTRLDRYKHIELHYDPVLRQYTVMPHRFSILDWEVFEEDDNGALEAKARFKQLVREEKDKERTTSKTVY